MNDVNLEKILKKYDTLNNGQKEALINLVNWYKSGFKTFNNESKQNILIDSLSGFGKSYLIRVFYEYLKLEKVLCRAMTFVGRGISVLKNMGIDKQHCSTLHSFLYNVRVDKKTGKKYFVKRTKIDNPYNIFIVDECFTLSPDLLKDILSYDTPIIFLGDSEQNKPLFNLNFLYDIKEDIRLSEPMRQSLDSNIFNYSHLFRTYKNEWKNLEFDDFKMLNVTDKANSKKCVEHLLDAELIICGTNKTRAKITDFKRKKLGFDSLPKIGEPIMISANNMIQGVYNGEIYKIINISEDEPEMVEGHMVQYYTLQGDDGDVKILPIMLDGFIDHLFDRNKLIINKYSPLIEIASASFGYCTTSYRVQGTTVDGKCVVLAYDLECFSKDVIRRALYMSSTRSKSETVVLFKK